MRKGAQRIAACCLKHKNGEGKPGYDLLNYKQPLSLNMIRIFSKLLRIPADALTKEYKLH